MGKSNKFDYSNRSSEGAKLGGIIGGAVLKESEKVKKDAERQALKLKKQTKDGSPGALDTTSTVHIIDLKAPGKALGDEGVRALASGLELALCNGTTVASVALEALDLSGNALTVESLDLLATIVPLAQDSLKYLNLSSNNIKVDSHREARQWESFLRSFKFSSRLEHIDLSGNTSLGSKALEIFARVYLEEPAVAPIRSKGSDQLPHLLAGFSKLAFDEDATAVEANSKTMPIGGSAIPRSDSGSSTLLRGLRSVPYLALHHTGLTDGAAGWLSYVLERHYYPVQLLEEAQDGSSEALMRQVLDANHPNGMEWSASSTAADVHNLGKDGLSLLCQVEMLRHHNLLDITAESLRSTDTEDASFDTSPDPDRDPLTEPTNRRVKEHNRTSIRMNDEDRIQSKAVIDIESLRKKIQRHVIAENGLNSVELWTAALRLVVTARNILLITTSLDSSMCGDESSSSIEPVDSPITPLLDAQEVDRIHGPPLVPQVQIPKLDEQEWPTMEVANQVKQLIKPLTPSRKKELRSFAKPTAKQTGDRVAQTPRRLIPQQQRDYQHTGSPAKADPPTRPKDSDTRHQNAHNLPFKVVERIASFILEEHDWSILSETQRSNAIRHGMNRTSLATEREWLKMNRSAQTWLLLDRISCLTYNDA